MQPPAISPADNRRGMIAISFGMACYTTNDAIVKMLARDLPFGEVIFLRGVPSVLLLLTPLIVFSGARALATAFTPAVLWRALFDGLSTAFFIAALVHMKIAEVSAVVLTAPLILTAMAALWLGGSVGWRRWAAIGVGLAGTMFIVKPSPGAFDVWALVALAAAATSAFRDLCTRLVGSQVPSLAVGVYGATAVMLTGALLGLGESWIMPTPAQAIGLAGAAACLGLGTYLIVLGFRNVEISAVAPFRYTLLLWAGIAGYVVFGEVPDGWALFGAVLIAASGLYTLHRETLRRRQLSATTIPPA